MSRLLAICGPTATGKSELAENVALHLGCDVISVDAMQVYRGMDIGTAKLPAHERRVPLHMVDVADVGEDYSVQMFQAEARNIVDTQLAAGRDVVFCGGTGLYLDAVIDEMDFPAGDSTSDVRAKYEAYADEHGADALWELLRQRDEASAALVHPNNVRRVVRALEMHEQGISYAQQTGGLHVHTPHYPCTIFGLTMDREELRRRIDLRVDRMFANGLLDEVKGLVDAGLADTLTARQAIGYKEVIGYLQGDCSLEEAVEEVKLRTRRYAKRQLTWFRRDKRVHWIDLSVHTMDDALRIVLEESE